MLQSDLLSQTIELDGALHVLFLNAAAPVAHSLVAQLAQRAHSGTITLAEDNVATLPALSCGTFPTMSIPYGSRLRLWISPFWICSTSPTTPRYAPALRVAAYALKPQ